MKDLARTGLFVVSIDAHLHGERKVPGAFENGVGRFGTDYHMWVHPSSVSHTARDISRILDEIREASVAERMPWTPCMRSTPAQA